ncbi:MAG: ATP-binding protein [Candidatus Promineifilaceae bacterium]|nr:ATP-binding protein [Candidatus Promineifilaceae bacterium]
MMTDPQTLSPINHIHRLWERLTDELAEILDAHGVAAAVASEIATFCGARTVVALAEPTGQYYDVWICDEGGPLTQTRWEGEQHAFRTLLEGGESLRQEKLGLPPADLIDSELWRLAEDVVLLAPLYLQSSPHLNRPTGVLCLVDSPRDCLVNGANVDALTTFISTFLQRAILRQETDRQRIESNIVYDLTYALTSTLDLQKIFDELADPVRRILHVEAVSIGLTEADTGDIVFVESLMGPLFRDLPPIRLKAGQGIAGHVVRSGKPLVVNNVYGDARFFSQADEASGFRTHSILAVPLKVEQRVIGVLEAINKRKGNFHENDLRLLQAIASPMAAAIENARLHGDVLAEKRRVETIFSSMSEGLLTVNHEMQITAVNDALLTLLNEPSANALVGTPADAAIEIKIGTRFTEFMERVLASAEEEESPQLACELVQPQGTAVPVLISGSVIRDQEGNVDELIFVFSDLRQVREVERMRDDFFHNIIHELRTPLATILMYARLLREGKAHGDQEKEDRFLGVIERESDRLQRMVRQMLQLAKLEAREIQRSAGVVDLNRLFDDILPPLADQAVQKGLLFSQRIPPDLPPITGSEEMIYSALKNLVENAVKFTLSGSVRVEASVDKDAVRVVVRDEGIGIPAEARPNLFKRFYRAQTAVERGIAGTGLGLYMAREAVEKHSGTIAVESVEGEGTTITVHLPVARS